MKYKTHYDAIPPALIDGDVLDVGCGDGSNQRISLNWPLLQACNYTGIDVDVDLFKYQPDKQFDTVLAIHVIEHIEQDRWSVMFERLCSWVKDGGFLVVGTPFMQSSAVYRRFKGPENQRHRVFGITHKLIESYLGDIWYFRYRGPYSQSLMCYWRKSNENSDVT